MSGGGKTQTSKSQVQIPSWVKDQYLKATGMASTAAATPWQAYSSDPNAFVAPLTASQQAGMGNINQYAESAQPWFQGAGAATLGGMGPANLGELDVNQYMNPYVQNVVQSTADILNQQNQQAMSGQLGNAIQGGAAWGDRSGIAAANLAQQQQLANANILSNLYSQGYQQAQGVAQQQQGAELAAQQANLARLLSGGAQLGQLGAGAQASALQGGEAQMAAGQQQQQTEQAGKSALYNQWLQERAYPFQVAQFFSNIATGLGANAGSTTSLTQPAGFFSGLARGGRTGKASGGSLDAASMGGHVNEEHAMQGYAEGGAIPDYSAMVMQGLFGGMDPNKGAYGLAGGMPGGAGFVPAPNVQQTEFKPAEAPPPRAPTTASDVMDVAKKGADLYNSDMGQNAMGYAKDFLGFTSAAARGGRQGLAVGGTPYGVAGEDPEDPMNTAGLGYVPKTEAPKEGLKPAEIPSTQQESGLSKVMDIAQTAAKIIPFFLKDGGVAGPRHGYADGGNPDEESWADWLQKKAAGLGLAEDKPVEQIRSEAYGGQKPVDVTQPYKDWLRFKNPYPESSTSHVNASDLSSGASSGLNMFEKTGPVDAANRQHDIMPAYITGLQRRAHQQNADSATAEPETIQPGLVTTPITGAETASTMSHRTPGVGGAKWPESPVEQTHGISPYAPRGLAEMESGNNFRAKNDQGHAGRYQFGEARLSDAKHAGIIPPSMTLEDFRNNTDAQRAVEDWHFKDINDFIDKNGLDQYIGKTINGTPVTRDGMLNVAHLGGKGGLQKFLTSNGRYNPADANGTSLAAYLSRGSTSPEINAYAGDVTAPRGGQNVLSAEDHRQATLGSDIGQTVGGANDWMSRNQNILLPILKGIGTMASSPSRYLGSAILQGIGAGAGSYMDRQTQLADLTQKNIQNIRSLTNDAYIYNMKYGTNVSVPEYAKMVGYTGTLPAGFTQTTSSMPSIGEPGVTTPAQPAATTQKMDINTFRNGTVTYPDGTVVSMTNDPASLAKFISDNAIFGNDPAVKAMIESAQLRLTQINDSNQTIDIKGNKIPARGSLETASKVAQQEANVKATQEFRANENTVIQANRAKKATIDEMANTYKKLQPGASVNAQSFVSSMLKVIDPNDAAGLQAKMADPALVQQATKDAGLLMAEQLRSMPGGAPQAELGFLTTITPTTEMQPETVKKLLTMSLANLNYQNDMYAGYHDPAKYNYDLNAYQREFINSHPFEAYMDNAAKQLGTFAGEKSLSAEDELKKRGYILKDGQWVKP